MRHPCRLLALHAVVVGALLGCSSSRKPEAFTVSIVSEDPTRELLVQGQLTVDGKVQVLPPTSTPITLSGSGLATSGTWECRTPEAALGLSYQPEARGGGYQAKPLRKSVRGGALGAQLTLRTGFADSQSFVTLDGGPLLPPKAAAPAWASATGAATHSADSSPSATSAP